MRVRLSRWGNSTAFRVPKVALDMLGAHVGQQFDLTVDGGEVRLRPVRETSRFTLDELLAEIDRLGPDADPGTVPWGPDVGSEIITDEP